MAKVVMAAGKAKVVMASGKAKVMMAAGKAKVAKVGEKDTSDMRRVFAHATACS